IGVVQEYTAKLKLDRIALLHQDGIHVRRNAEITQIEMTDAVLDDVVYLRAGDQVPADGLVLASESLDIDESLITGEADPILIGVVQEYTAKLKLDRIALLHQDGIHVRRNAEITQIEMTDAVLDDVVYLRAGDQVPADGLVLASESLDIDESLITGEADPVYKPAGATV